MPLSLDKVASAAPELLSLRKDLDAKLDARDLTGLTSQVAIVLDFSGSMGPLYPHDVQELLNKAVALATALDDDGEIDFFIFHTSAEYLGTVSLANFRTAVADLTGRKNMGSTNYEAAFTSVVNKLHPTKGFFGGKKTANAPLSKPADLPALALFITDGFPDDQKAAEVALAAASFRPIFWQMFSIGQPIQFLQNLDDLDGRYIDNADYKNFANLSALTADELFDAVLDEFPGWVAEERSRGQIK